uniref:Uncharacterized protein n=1 Tax=Lactuca sativa TaxID=4236 RepID=A0A9R1VNX1_LACSA|nr:hypothetical protein LSAT_V11C400215920 [Lactuca sativa]
MSNYNGSNQFDLNQKLERHTTFSFQQPSTFYSNSLMSEIPNEFIRTLQTLKMWREMEIVNFRQQLPPQDDINSVHHSLSFTGFSSAQSENLFIMSDTGFLVANKYGSNLLKKTLVEFVLKI